jgi:hypothetical protein
MNGKLIKTTAIIALSILLPFSGVAWALQNCLGEAIRHETDEHAESAIGTTEGVDLIFVQLSHSPHQPREIIHCFESHQIMGPLGQPSSVFRMGRSDESGSVEPSFSSDSASSRDQQTAWLAALASPRLSRHFLLLILRI